MKNDLNQYISQSPYTNLHKTKTLFSESWVANYHILMEYDLIPCYTSRILSSSGFQSQPGAGKAGQGFSKKLKKMIIYNLRLKLGAVMLE